MKHIGFSFLVCRMEPLLNCLDRTSNRSECPGCAADFQVPQALQEQRLSEDRTPICESRSRSGVWSHRPFGAYPCSLLLPWASWL